MGEENMHTSQLPVGTRPTHDRVSFHEPGEGSGRWYRDGCRCDECYEDYRDRRKAWRDKHKAANSPLYRRELLQTQIRKEGYRGTCMDCGAPTNGSDGPGKASKRCNRCSTKLVGLQARGKGKRITAVLEVVREKGTTRAVLEDLGINHNNANQALNRLVKYGMIRRVKYGVYEVVE